MLQLEEQIFALHEEETANDDEIVRLFNVWDPELRRLQADLEAGRSKMTRDEIWACVKAMPEAQEHTRLVLLEHSIFRKRYELMRQMEAIPASTPEGRRAKLLVLLNFWVDSEWRVCDEDAIGDIPTVRNLLIEFVGGEPAKQLRDQFS